MTLGHHEGDRRGCEAEILDKFPSADAAAVMDRAIADDLLDEADLDEAIAEDNTAARAAEHDLTKTMHKETE